MSLNNKCRTDNNDDVDGNCSFSDDELTKFMIPDCLSFKDAIDAFVISTEDK